MEIDQKLLRSIRNHKIAVLHPLDEDGEVLVHHLKRIGCRVEQFWPIPKNLPQNIDVIFFLHGPEETLDFDWLDEKVKSALIPMITYENPITLNKLTSIKVHGVITKPIRPFGILSHLVTALSLYKHEKLLLTRIEKLDENLKTRRLIEKATRILSSTHAISEDKAYGLIRSEAMNKQIPIFDMATSIINADKLMGSLKNK